MHCGRSQPGAEGAARGSLVLLELDAGGGERVQMRGAQQVVVVLVVVADIRVPVVICGTHAIHPIHRTDAGSQLIADAAQPAAVQSQSCVHMRRSHTYQHQYNVRRLVRSSDGVVHRQQQ